MTAAMTGLRDQLGGAVKFTVPTVADGHVYVGSQYSFSVFGLFPAATAAPAAPTGLTATTMLGQSIEDPAELDQPQPGPGPPRPASRSSARPTESISPAHHRLCQCDFVHRSRTVRDRPAYTYELVAVNQAGSSAPSGTGDGQRHDRAARADNNQRDGVGDQPVVDSRRQRPVCRRAVERRGQFTEIATVPASQTTYIVTGLAPGMYAYRVEAFNVNPTANSISNTCRGRPSVPMINQSGGFDNTTGLTANGSAEFAEGTARMTDDVDQIGSVFTNNRFTIGSFTTSFTDPTPRGDPARLRRRHHLRHPGEPPTALGQGLGGMGYQGIGKSIAIKLDTYQNPGDPSDSSTGLFVNGAGPSAASTRPATRPAHRQPGHQANHVVLRRHDADRDDHQHPRPDADLHHVLQGEYPGGHRQRHGIRRLHRGDRGRRLLGAPGRHGLDLHLDRADARAHRLHSKSSIRLASEST